MAAAEILTEDLPQLPLQIATVHIMLYALTLFKFYAIIGQYRAMHRPIKSTCYTYLISEKVSPSTHHSTQSYIHKRYFEDKEAFKAMLGYNTGLAPLPDLGSSTSAHEIPETGLD